MGPPNEIRTRSPLARYNLSCTDAVQLGGLASAAAAEAAQEVLAADVASGDVAAVHSRSKSWSCLAETGFSQ